MHRLMLITVLVAAVPAAATTPRLVVHEWGTFTSVAGEDGVAIDWRPLVGPRDLPSFVYRPGDEGGIRQTEHTSGGKGSLRGTVRMETPVLYFYASQSTEVSVRVGFPRGQITEWYPQANVVDSGIDWGRFRVVPGAAEAFPQDGTTSHYYAARETDAAPVRVCGHKTELEKFLFYRGVGSFSLPLSVHLEGDLLTLRNLGHEPLGTLIVFERTGDKLGYRVVSAGNGESVVKRPQLTSSPDRLARDLQATLVAQGLYEKEAAAMIKTWQGDWFEEGLRVLFVMPTAQTDAVLPLDIQPAPEQRVRVLVGRVEVIRPETLQAVRASLDELKTLRGPPFIDHDAIVRRLQTRYGRFAEPIFKKLLAEESDPQTRQQIAGLVRAWEPAAATLTADGTESLAARVQ